MDKAYIVSVGLSVKGPQSTPTVEVTLETDKDEVTKKVVLEGLKGLTNAVTFETTNRPRRVIVDKYGRTAKANGGAFSMSSFHAELEQTLIVYGTQDEVPTNREAARALQRAIRRQWSNHTVPVKSDKDVTEDELKTHHLLLIGRPDSNLVVERFRAALPVTFGSRSYVVRNETYAHPGSAVIAAGENPQNRRFSLVVFAGLGAESTLQAPPKLFELKQREAEVLILANGAHPRALVTPARELVRELDTK